MLGAVNAQQTTEFDFRSTVRSNSALYLSKGKDRIRKTVRLQNRFVHLPVTSGISSLSASHVDRNLTARLPRIRIEADASAFDPETPVHSVQESAQCKLNGATGRIEFDLDRAARKSLIFYRYRTSTDEEEQEC